MMKLDTGNKGPSALKVISKSLKTLKEKKAKKKARDLNDEDEIEEEEDLSEVEDEPVEEETEGEKLLHHTQYNIEDLENVGIWAQDIREIVKRDILGSLQNQIMLKRLERSYEVYEEVNHVRKKYHYNSESLNNVMNHFAHVVQYLVQFVTISEHDEALQDALYHKGITIDKHNHKLLVSIILHLEERVNKLHKEITETFKGYFDELDQLHFNDNLDDYAKVGKFIDVANALSIFENNIIQVLVMEIKDLAILAENNPRYHHLASAFKREFISIGDKEKRAKLMSQSRINQMISFIVVCFGLWLF